MFVYIASCAVLRFLLHYRDCVRMKKKTKAAECDQRLLKVTQTLCLLQFACLPMYKLILRKSSLW